MVGNQQGAGLDIVHVASNGVTTMAKGDVQFLIGPNGPFISVTNVTLP